LSKFFGNFVEIFQFFSKLLWLFCSENTIKCQIHLRIIIILIVLFWVPHNHMHSKVEKLNESCNLNYFILCLKRGFKNIKTTLMLFMKIPIAKSKMINEPIFRTSAWIKLSKNLECLFFNWKYIEIWVFRKEVEMSHADGKVKIK
jgi:hypothetical protein